MCSLPSAALGKGFAECNLAFAECLRHSAKNLNPVVDDGGVEEDEFAIPIERAEFDFQLSGHDDHFSSPSVPVALGKAFAECPIKDTRQRGLCRSNFYRVFFAECRTRQRLCRVQFDLCRVPRELGKEPESSSDNWTVLQSYKAQTS